MNVKNIILAAALLLSTSVLSFADDNKDKEIIRAMKDELNRNMQELKLDNYPTPFYLGYYYANSSSCQISAQLGSIIESAEHPSSSVGAVKLIMGDYKLNSEIQYGKPMVNVGMPADGNYNMIRHNFWLGTDIAYKKANLMFSNKLAYLRENPMTEEYEAINELAKVAPVTKMVNSTFTPIDMKVWEQNLREVSAIFKNYPKLFNSSVTMVAMNREIYYVTSENVVTKTPVSFVQIIANASTRTNDGIEFSDRYSSVSLDIKDAPSLEELKEQVNKFAQNLTALCESKTIEEFYSGPVLFEDMASMQLFQGKLLNGSALYAERQPLGMRGPGSNLENRIGKKVIDSRLTITNNTAMDKFNGTKLFGQYEIDADGVVPQKEMVLIENGILKGLLNKTIPTPKAPESTGSARYTLSNSSVESVVAPGTISISVNKGSKPETMKKQLIKAAKEEGLTYAYIVRKISGPTSLIYKVNVKDGSETMVRSAEVNQFGLQKLKRLLAISSKKKVTNIVTGNSAPASIIYPSSILVEDVEISELQLNKQKAPALEFPLVRDSKK